MADGLKAEYFEHHIREKIQGALERQKQKFASRQSEISGSPLRGKMIRDALEAVSLNISRSGEGVIARMAYPVEIRFFDMKRILNWKIYNRELWGTAYRDLLGDIKYEFEDWIRANYPDQLRKYGFK